MKTVEELNALKEEVENLNKKLAELTDEELEQVTGGKQMPANSTGGIVSTCMGILALMGLYPTEEYVRSMIEDGGSILRNWALSQSGGNKMANLIPIF